MNAKNIMQIGTRLFCSSSLVSVTLISMGKIQDGCTIIKIHYVLDGYTNFPEKVIELLLLIEF